MEEASERSMLVSCVTEEAEGKGAGAGRSRLSVFHTHAHTHTCTCAQHLATTMAVMLGKETRLLNEISNDKSRSDTETQNRTSSCLLFCME